MHLELFVLYVYYAVFYIKLLGNQLISKALIWFKAAFCLNLVCLYIYIYIRLLPERDYVTFGYLLSQIHLSSVVSLSVGNVDAPYSASCNFQQFLRNFVP